MSSTPHHPFSYSLADEAVAFVVAETDFWIDWTVYTPPNVAKSGCNTFNAITGEKTYCPSTKCGYYSKFMQRL